MSAEKVAPPERRNVGRVRRVAMPLFDSLYNFGRGLVDNQNDAEDLVQETYLKALSSFGSFQPGTNFQATKVVFYIARHVGTCVKTVQRWERPHGFPIRHVSKNKGRLYSL